MSRGRHPPALTTALLGAVLVGCSGDDPEPAGTATTVTQSGDTTIIVPALDGPIGRLVSDLVIGDDESVEDAVFGAISDAALGPDGRIHVVDSQADVVSRFDSEGVFDRVVTRRGEGPGEVADANMIAIGPDGYLAVAGLYEVEIFSPSGAATGTVRARRPIQHPIAFDSVSRLFIHTGPARTRAFWAPWTVPGTNIRFIEVVTRSRLEGFASLVATSSGERVDSTEAPFRLDEYPCITVGEGEPNEGRICMGTTYSWLPLFDWLRDGRVVANRTDLYQLDLRQTTGGGPVTSIRPPRAPLPLEPGLARYMDGEWMEANGSVWDSLMVTPTHKPAVADLRVTGDDRIWVRLHAPSEQTENDEGEETWVETESRFDIFTSEGEHVGHVTGPADLTLRDARGDTVLTTRTGAFGVPTVERFVIQWEESGG